MAYNSDGSVIIEFKAEYDKYIKDVKSIGEETAKAGKSIEKSIGDSSKEARISLDKLKEAQKELNKLYKSGSIDEKQYKKLSEEITSATYSIKEQEKALKQASSSYDKNTSKAEELHEEVKTLSRELDILQETLYKESGFAEFEKNGLMTEQRLDELMEVTTNSSKEFQKLSKQLDEAEESFIKYSKNAEDAKEKTVSLGEGLSDASNNANKFSNEVKQVNEQAGNTEGITTLKLAFANLVAEGIKLAINSLKDFVKEGLDFSERFAVVEERMSSVFGARGQDEINQWSENSIEKFGLATGIAKEYAVSIGEISVNMGVYAYKAQEMGQGITELIGNYAKLRGADPDKMFDAIKSAMTGNTKALTDYDIKLKKLPTSLSDAEKAEKYYQEILSQGQNNLEGITSSTDKYGSQINELKQRGIEAAETFANVIKPQLVEVLIVLNSSLKENEDVIASLAKIVGAVIKTFVTLINAISGIPPGVLAVIGTVLTLVGGFIKTTEAMENINKGITVAKTAWNTFGKMLDSPLMQVLALVTALSILLFLILAIKEGAERAAHSINKGMGSIDIPDVPTNSPSGSPRGRAAPASSASLYSSDNSGDFGDPQMLAFAGGVGAMPVTQVSDYLTSGANTSYNTRRSSSVYNNDINVTIPVKDLEEIGRVEQFIDRLQVNDRKRGGGTWRGDMLDDIRKG